MPLSYDRVISAAIDSPLQRLGPCELFDASASREFRRYWDFALTITLLRTRDDARYLVKGSYVMRAMGLPRRLEQCRHIPKVGYSVAVYRMRHQDEM